MPDAPPPVDRARDHVVGRGAGPELVVYGDYECPYTRRAYRSVQILLRQGEVPFTFAYRQFPLTQKHPHALAAARAAEGAGLLGRFWAMHDLLFRHQDALEDDDLRRYAAEAEIEAAAFDRERDSDAAGHRIVQDLQGGLAAGVSGTPTLFIDGVRHDGPYTPPELAAALRAAAP
jgi:Na+:H+ antiporter, NhaA family